MTFMLPTEDPAARAALHYPPLDQEPASRGEIRQAATEAERVRIDSWGQQSQTRNEILLEVIDRVGDFTPPGRSQGGTRTDGAGGAIQPQEYLAEVARRRQTNPHDWQDVPATADEIEAEAARRLRRRYDDAQAVLSNTPEGVWAPRLWGELWAGITDHSTVATLPIGAGSGSLARIGLTAAGAGVAGEGLSLPSQYRMAETLGIEDPNAMRQLATAAATSGALDMGVAAGGRYLLGRQLRTEAAADAPAPDGSDARWPEQDRRITQAERALNEGRSYVAPVARDPSEVSIEYAFSEATIRDQDVQPDIIYKLQDIAAGLGPDIDVRIVSGGQDAAGVPGARRTGSERHDHGGAADLVLLRRGAPVTPAQDPALYEDFFRRAGGRFEGVGHYDWGVHVGGGKRAAWGPDTTSATLDPRFAAAIAEGRARGTGPVKPPAIADFSFEPRGNASPTRNRVGYVFGRLLERGYEPHVAAGLVGNLMQESGGGLNVGAVGDGGNAFGMGQWNGARMRALQSFARQRGKDPSDLDTQIDFLDHELRGSESAAGRLIRAAPDAATAARIASDAFWRPGIPNIESRIRYASDLMSQYERGRVPRAGGTAYLTPGTAAGIGGGPTRRGFTGAGQATAGETTIEVDYEVVDAGLLRQATGDLQPRDRGRKASDEQVAEIAARLDPMRLMPSPEADRGAPIVGPDGIVESGNGRVLALRRAAERFPDRFEAYVEEIKAQGFTIPEGVETPVLISRRRTEMDEAARQRFVREANAPSVARMSATERSAMDARSITPEITALFQGGQPLNSSANKAFVSRALANLPQSERSALIDADGALNAEGALRLRQALFAQAYDAPDIAARAMESGAGDLRSLIDALEEAAPEWAQLRGDIAAGLIRPEMDITGNLLEAVRLIANARAVAARDRKSVSAMIDELLTDVDMLDGIVSPLTAALVRKLAPQGRAARAEDIAGFLRRYAAEARKAGSAAPSLLGDGPGLGDVLRAVDGKALADLGDVTPIPARADIAARQTDVRADTGADFADGSQSEVARAAARAEIDALVEPPAPEDAAGTIDPPDAAARAELDRLAREFADETIEAEDGTMIPVRDFARDLQDDETLLAAVEACTARRVS